MSQRNVASMKTQINTKYKLDSEWNIYILPKYLSTKYLLRLLLSHFSRVRLLCDPIDGSLPGSPIPGILQARTLGCVAISFSNAGKGKVKVKSLSRVCLLETPWTAAYQAPPSMGFSRQEYWSELPLPPPTKIPTDYPKKKKKIWINLHGKSLANPLNEVIKVNIINNKTGQHECPGGGREGTRAPVL